MSFPTITLCVTSQLVIPKMSLYFVMTQSGNFWIHPHSFLNEAPRHEDVYGSGGKAPRILNLGTRCRRVFSFTHPSIYPRGNSARYPLGWRLGGPPELFWVQCQRNIISCSCRESNPGLPYIFELIVLDNFLR
jgi:hypothetical protein